MTHSASMPSKFTSLSVFIQARQDELEIDDAALSSALGYEKEAVVRQIKLGAMRLPITKVAALSEVLNVNAIELMKLHLGENDPALLDALNGVLLSNALSAPECRLIQSIRKLAKGRPTTPLVFDGDAVVALIVA